MRREAQTDRQPLKLHEEVEKKDWITYANMEPDDVQAEERAQSTPTENVIHEEIRRLFKELQKDQEETIGNYSKASLRFSYTSFEGEALLMPKKTRNTLAKLHGEFGHPSNEKLGRLLLLAGADKNMVDAVKHMKCDICVRITGPQDVPQVSIGHVHRFNEKVGSDTFFFIGGWGGAQPGNRFRFRFRVVCAVRARRSCEGAKRAICVP